MKKRPGTFSKRQVVKVLSMQRVIWPVVVASRPGHFHQGDFVTLPRRNKSCSSCIKFVGSAVKLLVYAATLLINREEYEARMGNPRLFSVLPFAPTFAFSRCPVVNRRGKSCPRTQLARRALPLPSRPFSRPRQNIPRLSSHLFEKN